MNLPEYKSLDIPNTELGKREVVDSYHLAEVIIREMIDESSFGGILIARKGEDFFYLADPIKYRVLPENKKISSNDSGKFKYATLSRLMVRVDREGKQERTNRTLAINKSKFSSR